MSLEVVISKSKLFLLALICSMFSIVAIAPAQASAAIGDPCSESGFLGLPTWYKYLETEQVVDPVTARSFDASGNPQATFDASGNPVSGVTCNVKLDGLSSIWLIVAAVLDIMLRIAAFVAVCFIIYGGVLYIISQSQPDKTSQALKTVISALVGLVIAIAAAALVAFVAGSF